MRDQCHVTKLKELYRTIEKLFDTVTHSRLLAKQQDYAISGQVLKWIEAFLMGRSMRVMVNGNSSCWVEVVCGVLQGSRAVAVPAVHEQLTRLGEIKYT